MLFSGLLSCVLMALSITGFALDAPATEPQKAVLALYGSRPDLPANLLVDEIIRSTLERELGPRLDFYAEFIDTARWPEAETQSAVHDYLRRRYAHKKLSAVIAVAQSAIDFVRIYMGMNCFQVCQSSYTDPWTLYANGNQADPLRVHCQA